MMSRPFAAIFVMILAASCATRQQASEAKLVAGDGHDARPGQFPATVFFPEIGAGCSGAKVDDWHILTAGHCTIDENGALLAVFFSGGELKLSNDVSAYRLKDEDWIRAKVKRAHLHPSFEAALKSGDMPLDEILALDDVADVAVIELSEPIASDVIPNAAVAYAALRPGDDVIINGYGALEPSLLVEHKASGQLRYAEKSVGELGLGHVVVPPWPRGATEAKHELESRSQVAIGDSGGPLYRMLNGKLAVAGITSYSVYDEEYWDALPAAVRVAAGSHFGLLGKAYFVRLDGDSAVKPRVDDWLKDILEGKPDEEAHD